MKASRIVFLVCPYGQIGGGMGSLMASLAALQTDPTGRFRLIPLDSRGQGSLLMSPFYLLAASLRIILGRMTGRLAVVHLNLAERGSVYRKGVLLAVSKLTGAKVLLHLHAAQIIEEFNRMPKPAQRALAGMFRSANQVVVLGEPWRRWISERFDVPESDIIVMRNGVPSAPVVRPERSASEPFSLLFLGNLLTRKGLSDLLHAFAAVTKRGYRATLTVAGGGDIQTYRSLSNKLGIQHLVEFRGWVDQPTARLLLATSDALALPSYDEGLPLVILEALAAGTAVICTPIGAIPEVLTDEEHALFVSPGDVDGLTAALIRLIEDVPLRQRLANAGNALYQREFTMDSFASRIGQVYASLSATTGSDR